MPRKTNEEKKIVKNVEKKPTSKKAPTNSSTKKINKTNTTIKITTSKKTTTKQINKMETKTKNTQKSIKNKSTNSILEYYDLPYRYNQTIVKILAQTPNTLFIYWDISDSDKVNLEKHYGKDFFNITKPVLIVYNETLNYNFEIEINDFANSWYLHVKDPNCKYTIELGRRPYKYTSNISDKYIYVSSSNKIDMPNDHILFEKFNSNILYKNVKNNSTTKKAFSNISSYKNMKELYNIYSLYKEIYKDDLFREIINDNIFNPSSGSSSSFK